MLSAAASALSTPAVADPRWAAVYGRLRRTEGGFSDAANDHGGATNYGISLRFLLAEGKLDSRVAIEFDVDHDGDIDLADVRRMSAAAAEDLYRSCFWLKPGFSVLQQPFDAALFDQGVNGGVRAAVTLLQKALNSVFRTYLGLEPLVLDGALGRGTKDRLLIALSKNLSIETLAAYRTAAADRYRTIVARDPSQAEFLTGWLNRASELGDV